jgi:hypothetical protein
MRSHPHLYEFATWPWLERLSAEAGKPLTLASVPDAEWERLKSLGFDLVYLMGVWRRSPLGRQIARSEPRLFDGYDRALPGWSLADVVGSPFCIADYSPDPRIGTWNDLDALRTNLRARGMGLVLDFVPNHTAFDHPWVASHPERYVTASAERFRAAPAEFRLVEAAECAPCYVACGRDPNFPAWTDVAQLNYFEPDTRAAMIAQLQEIAEHCDAVRCDMAMLVLNDVFARTWGAFGGPGPQTEFWTEAREAVPDLMLIAEAYWDLEWRLQELGFAYTYDKRLYDRLAHESSGAVRDHLRAATDYQKRSARFLENHDEPRSYDVFGPGRIEAAAAVCATVPGMRFYYDGQLEGRTRLSPVQLGRWAEEPEAPGLPEFYARLLKAADDPVCHEADWALLDVAEAGDPSYAQLIAFRWARDGRLRVIVSNPGDTTAQGHVLLGDDLPAAASNLVFDDLLTDTRYEQDRAALRQRGLYVRLAPGKAHVFEVSSTAS